MEEQRKRVEDHMTKMVEEIDKIYLRKMQVFLSNFRLHIDSIYILQRVQNDVCTCIICFYVITKIKYIIFTNYTDIFRF